MLVPPFSLSLLRAGSFAWGKPNLLRMFWARTHIIPELMRFGYSIIWADFDVIWFRNPNRLLEAYPEVRHDNLRSRSQGLYLRTRVLPPLPLPLLLPWAAVRDRLRNRSGSVQPFCIRCCKTGSLVAG